MNVMNSAAASAYTSHSYYRGEGLSVAGHAAVAANWPNLNPTGKYSIIKLVISSLHHLFITCY